MKTTFFSMLILLGLCTISVQAQGPSPSEQRLREQVRALTGQLRTLETEKAALTAEKTAAEEKIKAKEKDFADLVMKSKAEKEAADKEKERLAGELSAANKETANYKALLTKESETSKKFQDLANKTEEARRKSAAEVVKLSDVVVAQRMHNRKMHEVAMEVLDRYAKFGLGTALTAREPFVGITRTRLETMMEEYGSRLDAEIIKIEKPTVKPKPAAPTVAERLAEKPATRPADGKPAGKREPASKP